MAESKQKQKQKAKSKDEEVASLLDRVVKRELDPASAATDLLERADG